MPMLISGAYTSRTSASGGVERAESRRYTTPPPPAPVPEPLASDPEPTTPVPATSVRQALRMIQNAHTPAPFKKGYDRAYVPKIVDGKRTFVHKDSPEVIVWVDQDRDQDNRN